MMLKVLKGAGTIGILADQNTLPAEGVFVDFFGTQACTTTGIARVALHTDAAVVPGYAYWDPNLRKYRLRFEPPVDLVRTGDTERDVRENTQRFTKVIEEIIRKHPEQWVWIPVRGGRTGNNGGRATVCTSFCEDNQRRISIQRTLRIHLRGGTEREGERRRG